MERMHLRFLTEILGVAVPDSHRGELAVIIQCIKPDDWRRRATQIKDLLLRINKETPLTLTVAFPSSRHIELWWSQMFNRYEDRMRGRERCRLAVIAILRLRTIINVPDMRRLLGRLIWDTRNDSVW